MSNEKPIQRYEHNDMHTDDHLDGPSMLEADNGDYVLFSDHEKALAEVAAERDRLKLERGRLARWKTEALTVESWWSEVDAEVRKHPETLLGQYVAASALQLIRERDEFKKLAVARVAEKQPEGKL